MSTYVLIHGAWHGGWCWDKVVPLLKAAGHTVIAPDLPGHGEDRTPPAEVTMAAYADRVCSIVSAQPEPVVLVGHSMGGGVISAAAEQCPDNIKRLVFLTAFLVAPEGGPPPRAANELAQYIVRDEAAGTITVRDEGLVPAFYHDCSPEDIAFARARLAPQPVRAAGPQPRPLTRERFGSIPRAYIECLQDRAITIEAQRAMVAAAPCDPVLTLDASHSPFFSMPEALAARLLALA